ncbi:rhodanese-related sulfurtransferase [Luteimonas cucumeris]|uniref:Rhodanese-related sulfurtransferase n=1 Tax=Luteimonas cucumeris TaxID=985012 RepID=A0A562L699_9GAMM|nr:rhodanese-like domain-containing protein [Luteimonas cucumeris]TWI03046.1 rhodanese-related sulfurtransferase [Luteimonas cucumeris]
MPRMRESVLALLLLSSFAGSAAERVAPAQLQAMLQSRSPAPLVLDVRSEQEFADGHVPQAVLIPHDQLQDRLGELDPARGIVVYCRTGRRSAIAEEVLVRNGFRVRELEGNWLGWQASGLPVETATPTPLQTPGKTP